MLGAAASTWDLRARGFSSLAVPLGCCANACVSFFLLRCVRVEESGRKLAVEPTLAWFFLARLCYGGGCKRLQRWAPPVKKDTLVINKLQTTY